MLDDAARECGPRLLDGDDDQHHETCPGLDAPSPLVSSEDELIFLRRMLAEAICQLDGRLVVDWRVGPPDGHLVTDHTCDQRGHQLGSCADVVEFHQGEPGGCSRCRLQTAVQTMVGGGPSGAADLMDLLGDQWARYVHQVSPDGPN